ncbi:hypothetical protein IFM89_017145 [Coptis chinensis]|uniref:60S ribosomal protein L6 n=1 Tax=Coptis chinensis TaxID=261450 RepID=A0A835ICM9_9MAGN|nr:hypothetical protein IFM89_017145 [Coptis chinensis]
MPATVAVFSSLISPPFLFVTEKSSKNAAKRNRKEKASIEAALRNSPTAGIHITERNENHGDSREDDDDVPYSTSQGNQLHLSKKKFETSKSARTKNRDLSDSNSTNEDLSEDASDQVSSDGDDLVSNHQNSRDKPSSNESRKSKKSMGCSKNKTTQSMAKRSKKNIYSSQDSSSEDSDGDEFSDDNGKVTKKSMMKDLLMEDLIASEDDDDVDTNAFESSNNPSPKDSHQSSKTTRGPSRPKQKYILDEGRKKYVLQQIGKLWRALKSRLRGQIRACKRKKDIARLKPEDVKDKEWEMFVKNMSKKKFIMRSQKFQEMKAKQDLQHTCSRQGYAHLEDKMGQSEQVQQPTSTPTTSLPQAKNGGVFPRHDAKPDEQKPTEKPPKFYPANDVKKPFVNKCKHKPTKLRASITPGTVLIILAERFKGKRVVFLNQLASGLLLVTGPFKINGVPLRRVKQSYVIATSTKVDITDLDVTKFDDKYFAKDVARKKKKGEGQFYEAEKEEKNVLPQGKKDDKKKSCRFIFDKFYRECIVPELKAYLAARFSLKSGMKPHELVF